MGIQQKLHTKLVQKLILTPSLQQAIKLLPMSTLELSDLLNQEMVENPMLEEVPTEELQPADTAAAPEKTDPEKTNKTDAWDDQDYEYFFGDYLADGEDRRRSPASPAEPSGPGNRAQARAVDRRSERAHRDHPAPRPEAGQPLQPDAVAVRDPGRLRRQGRGPVRRPAQRGRAAAD